MEDLETSKIDAEADDFSLIDVSASDDDFLMASSSSDPTMMDDQSHFVKGVPSNQPSDSLASHKAKPGKCNLRKSLAWDSAFFTNAGVLDAEELSSIIEGTETSAKQKLFLPGIEEELSKSTDSISTFQSDNATLESLEADLFSDIRASIQRSSKSPTMRNGSAGISGEEGSNNECSKKIVGPSSRKMAKLTSVSSKLNSGVQGPVRSLKPNSVSKQVMKPPVNRSREPSTMLPRLPKAAAGPSLQAATTTKRMSVDAGRVKLDAKAAGSVKGKGASSSVSSHQVDPRKPLPKTPAVSKVSTVSSVLTRKPMPRAPAVSKASANSSVTNNRVSSRSSHSSCDSSSSSASENVRKSQIGGNRRTTDKNVNLPSGSKIRTLSKVVEKVKSQNNESRLSAYLKSTSNLSPNISPASSISEWSTESSSSTATINQKHFGLNQCSPLPQDGTVDGNASQNPHNLSINQVPGTCGQSLKQPSTGSAVSGTRTGSAKPSGLRMPSPNIGFFDGAKAGAKTPSSSSRCRSALPSTLPRSVAGSSSPSGAINNTKLGTSASKMTATAAGTVRPQQRVADVNLKAAEHLLDHSNDKPEKASAVKHVDKEPDMSDEFPLSDPPKSALESNGNAPKGPDVPWNDKPEKSSAVKHVDKEPDMSDEFPVSDPPKSALESNGNAPKEPDVAKFVLDSQLVGEDNLASDHASGGISSDFLKSNSPKSTLEKNNEISGVSSPRKNVPDREVGLQNILSASFELPKGNLSLPALEASEVAFITDGGKQVLELASVTKDNLVASEKETSPEENVLSTVHLGKADDCSEDPSEPSKGTSVDSALEKNSLDRETRAIPDLDSVEKDDLSASSELPKGNSLPALEVSEVAFITDGGKQTLELASVTKDNLVASEKETSPEENVLSTVHLGKADDCSEDPSEPSKSTSVDSAFEKSSVDRETHALPDLDSVEKDDLSASSELPKGNLSLPALEVSEVAFITDGGKQALELASVTKDNLVASEKGTSPEENVLSIVHLGKADDCSEDPSEPSESTSVDSALEKNSVDRETHALPDLDSVEKDDLMAPEEGIERVASDCVNAASEDGFSVLDTTNVVSPHSYAEHSSSSSIVYHDLGLSQHIDETIVLEAGSQHKQQDEGGSVEYSSSSSIVYHDLGLSQHIDETIDLEAGSQHKQQDVGGSVEYGATDEDQRSAIVYSNSSPCQHNDEIDDLEVVSQHKHDEGGSVEHGVTDEKQCSGIAYNNLSPSQHIHETDNLEVISQHKQQDGGRVEHGVTKENQCSEIFCINLSPSQHIDEIDALEAISQQNQQHEGGSLEYDTTNEDRCTEIGYNILSSSQHIDETDDLEIVSQHTQQDEDDSVEHGATEGVHCSRNGLAEIIEDKVEEFITNVGAADKFDIQDKSDGNAQTEFAQYSSLITCSPTSPTLGDGSVERTPFTIKNTVSNVVEDSKFSSGSATEAFSKVDDAVVVSSLDKFQKENS